MLGELPLTTRRVTVAADKAYDTRAWVAAVRRMGITPHVAQIRLRVSAAARSMRARPDIAGYALSHRKRKADRASLRLAEDRRRCFRKLRHRGGRLVDWMFSFGAAAYNLVRWRNLVAQRA